MNATANSNWDSHIGQSGTGTLNINGGDIDLNFVEVGRNSGSVGTINLNSGSLVVARGSKETANGGISMHLGSNDNDSAAGSGTMNIYGGSFLTRVGVELGNQDNPGNSGTGSFNVFGSLANIGIGSSGSLDGKWFQSSGFTLGMSIDTGGVSKIFVDEVGDDGGAQADFALGSLLDLNFTGAAMVGTWTLLELEDADIVDNGLALASGVDSNWSFAIDNSGDNGLLTATYVPEPSSTALLGLGGLALILRRRK